MEQFYQAYLYAYIFWLCVALGCYGFMLLHHVIRATWGLPAIRIWEAGARTLPFMGLLFVPILFGMQTLYPWTNPQLVHADKALQLKQFYLNTPFFIGRFVAFFLIWWLFTHLLTRWSYDQDKTGDASLAQKRTNLAAPGIVVFVLTLTFAFTDWVMSLDPHWFSTIFGVWFLVASGMAALSLTIILLVSQANREPYSYLVSPVLTRDLGNLLLTFTLLWAYISLSQYLIIFSGNLPEEITFYLHRKEGGWVVAGALLILSQFFIPFLALLSNRAKRSPKNLFWVAVWIFAWRIVDIAWTIVPFFKEGLNILHPVLFVVVGLVWYGLFRWQLSGRPLVPTSDVRIQEVLSHA